MCPPGGGIMGGWPPASLLGDAVRAALRKGDYRRATCHGSAGPGIGKSQRRLWVSCGLSVPLGAYVGFRFRAAVRSVRSKLEALVLLVGGYFKAGVARTRCAANASFRACYNYPGGRRGSTTTLSAPSRSNGILGSIPGPQVVGIRKVSAAFVPTIPPVPSTTISSAREEF